MKILYPQIATLSQQESFLDRESKAVFVRKHNLQVNLDAVQSETENVTDLNASDWLFLIEGFRNYSAVENRFLDEFIEGLNIEAEDPVKPPFTDEIAEAASLEKIVAALSVLTMDYLDFIEDKTEELGTTNLEILFDQSLNVVAKAFGVSPKALLKEFKKLQWRNEDRLGQQLLTLSDKRKQLINESNLQSKASLVAILNQHRQPNLFIMSGIEHATIFTQQKDENRK